MSSNQKIGNRINSSSPTPTTTQKYTPIDFRPLQGFQTDWETTNEIQTDWKEMKSACLLYYNGDVTTVVHWIGGPHINAQIDPPKTLSKLKPIPTTDVYDDLKRILPTGAPALCNAQATESNFQEYLKYGNHQPVKQNQKEKTFEVTNFKQSKRGLTIIMDPATTNPLHTQRSPFTARFGPRSTCSQETLPPVRQQVSPIARREQNQ